MELNTNTTKWEYTPSDNSHLFGFPVTVWGGYEATIEVFMPREECMRFIDEGKFMPYERAGIDVNCHYTKDN